MKSILISIHPEWIIKIFNGDKTAEIRRTAPKKWVDYLSGKANVKPEPMTGYIYCTQGNRFLFKDKSGEYFLARCLVGSLPPLNAKVVASFTLREVDLVPCLDHFNPNDMEQTSLTWHELHDYVGDKNFYVWHISDLQIFDKPMEISDFGPEDKVYYSKGSSEVVIEMKRLNRGPQSWQYVEDPMW